MSSQPLLQQQLLDPPPSRRLIVPAGHSAHWGVDPSSVRVAVSGVRAACGPRSEWPDRWVHSESFMRLEGLARLAEVYERTRLFTLMLCDADFPYPGVVYIERPGGANRNYPLDYAVGVIVAAMDAALREATGARVRFEEVVPAHWKLVACGRGQIFKPDAKKGRTGEYGVLTWAKLNGYTGSSYDEADALGIAECARREVALDER